MGKLDNPVQMAAIGAPHGVKGEVRVKTFTEDPAALGGYGPLYDESGRAFEVTSIRPAKNVHIVRFKGVTTREQAEALNGLALYVDRSALPDDLDEEEFYHADLIGLAVEDETGAAIGKLAAIHDFGGGDILEIALPDRRTVLIPFTKMAAPEVDMAASRIRVDRAAAGLVEKEDPVEAREPRRRRRGPKSAGDKR